MSERVHTVESDIARAPLQRASAALSAEAQTAAAHERARLGVQAKLTVNAPGDRWEQEADRVADAVAADRPAPVAGPLALVSTVQRLENSGEEEEEESLQTKRASLQRQAEEEEEEESLQTKASNAARATPAPGPAFASALASESQSGQPLSPTARAAFEPHFARDLSAVRLHTGAGAASLSRQINARAFTHQNHIFFANGQLDTQSREGRHLLAHEITHTLQQGEGRGEVAPKLQRRNIFQEFAGLFAGEDFDDEELSAYLEAITTANDIQDFTDSDNKARALVNRLQEGQDWFGHTDTGALRGLLIAEMLSGATLNADEQSILYLLQTANRTQLWEIFTGGRLTREAILEKFQGDEREQLEEFFNTRLSEEETHFPAMTAEAEAFAFARGAIRQLEEQGRTFSQDRDGSVSSMLRDLRTTFTAGEEVLRPYENADAERERLHTNYRNAVQAIFAAQSRPDPQAIREPPTVPELYEEHRDELLPFVLPRHQAAEGSDQLSQELEAPLPDDATEDQRRRHQALTQARRQLIVVATAIELDYHDLFDTQGAVATVPLPDHTAARFADNVPQQLRRGLQSTAARLSGGGLRLNSTVMAALDLSRYPGGGYHSYRFSRLEMGEHFDDEIWIEQLGTVGIEGLVEEERREMQERFDRLGFVNGGGFDQEEFDQVLIGLSEIPDARLTPLDGLRFEREDASAEDPEAAGDYSMEEHRLRLFDRAFNDESVTRLGTGARPLSYAAAAVVHEVGHALDRADLRTTLAATTAAEDAILQHFGTGGRQYDIPARNDPARAQYDPLAAALQQAQEAEAAARGGSGIRFQAGSVTDRNRGNVAFRQAAIRDGARAPSARRSARGFPTSYPDPESYWQEYFAEAVMLYETSPEVLRRHRPNVFAHLQQEFPQ